MWGCGTTTIISSPFMKIMVHYISMRCSRMLVYLLIRQTGCRRWDRILKEKSFIKMNENFIIGMILGKRSLFKKGAKFPSF